MGAVYEATLYLCPAAVHLARGMIDVGHKVAAKSTVVASSLRLASIAQQAVAQAGVVSLTARCVRDLGADACVAKQRVPTAKKRLAAARARATKLYCVKGIG